MTAAAAGVGAVGANALPSLSLKHEVSAGSTPHSEPGDTAVHIPAVLAHVLPLLWPYSLILD